MFIFTFQFKIFIMSIPVFGGYRYHEIQTGSGFLDVLRGFGKHAIPVILRGIGSFISGFSERQKSGQSMGEAAKASLKEAGLAAGKAGLEVGSKAVDDLIEKNKSQAGSGRRRSKRRSTKKQYKKKGKMTRASFNF